MPAGKPVVVAKIPGNYDPSHIYFHSGNTIYRMKKKLIMKHAGVVDKDLKKEIKDRNKKLWEIVCKIPQDVYRETHFYGVNGAGEIVDRGERLPRKRHERKKV